MNVESGASAYLAPGATGQIASADYAGNVYVDEDATASMGESFIWLRCFLSQDCFTTRLTLLQILELLSMRMRELS